MKVLFIMEAMKGKPIVVLIWNQNNHFSLVKTCKGDKWGWGGARVFLWENKYFVKKAIIQQGKIFKSKLRRTIKLTQYLRVGKWASERETT